jgi:anaphase-promoting complex subunit 5
MVDKLLVALWHAEFQCRYGLYRTGLVMLADISMEFGLSQKAQRMVEDIMPQVVSRSRDQSTALKSFLDHPRRRSRAKGLCMFHSSPVCHHGRA